MEICTWCGYEYPVHNNSTEQEHLKMCPVFSKLPSVFCNNKTYVELPYDTGIFIERVQVN